MYIGNDLPRLKITHQNLSIWWNPLAKNSPIIEKNNIKLDKWMIGKKTMQNKNLNHQPTDMKETNEQNKQQNKL